MEKLTRIQIATLKRNMANVASFQKKVDHLQKEINEAQAELDFNQSMVNQYDTINKGITGGLTAQEYFAGKTAEEAAPVEEAPVAAEAVSEVESAFEPSVEEEA